MQAVLAPVDFRWEKGHPEDNLFLPVLSSVPNTSLHELLNNLISCSSENNKCSRKHCKCVTNNLKCQELCS